MNFKNIDEREIKIGDIPLMVMTPKWETAPYPTIIFYHGWSSTAEKQRFRAYILATLGYQVIIPTGIYHGERNPVDYTISEGSGNYFWSVVLKNIEESNTIIDYAVKNLIADEDRIAVMGHSMGGFTSAGIFAYNKNIKTAVVLNGSCDYGHSNRSFGDVFNTTIDIFTKEFIEKIEKHDPMNNLYKIIDRPILMLHGDSDSLIDVNIQRDFYAKISPMYENPQKIKYIEYPNLNHIVSTNMMEEIAIWCEKFL